MATNEALLELMVKIASDPVQWDKVHTLLRKIDEDLETSKKIYERIQQSNMQPLTNEENIAQEDKDKNKDPFSPLSPTPPKISTNPIEAKEFVRQTNASLETTRISHEDAKIILNVRNDQLHHKPVNFTKLALKSNEWPDFQSEGRILYKPETALERQVSKYPWPNESKSGSKSYSRNFAYHRVTGHPLYHTNFDKNPKAYIAVSVIAPKPLNSRPEEEDLILENELRQLKPWTHKQNLKNMAAIRSRWIIQTENNNNEAVAP